MSSTENKKFSKKHESNVKPNPLITEKVLEYAVDRKLPCFVAFKIVKELQVAPAEVGRAVDLLDFRLAKCQLGLYGYQPKKRKVKPKMPEDQNLKKAIADAVVDGRVECKKVWEIADLFNIHKMKVSCACEAMKIKIIKCQLGAF